MRLPTTLVIIVAAASQVGATDCGQITRDQGFDLWCGDRLCYWDVERGAVRQVPTWHRGDHGVELQGQDVSIAQVTDNVPDCLLFGLVADIEVDSHGMVRAPTAPGLGAQIDFALIERKKVATLS